jgi:uncharacterized protein (TIGR02271 family)
MTTASDPTDPADGTRPGPPQERSADVRLSEEQLRVDTEQAEVGRVRARKTLDTEHVEERVSRGVEQADTERTGPLEGGDSGEVITLADGSLSIPVLEEQIVVEKRWVVRERVVVRKHTVYEDHLVQAELQRERLDVDVEGDVRVTGDGAEGPAGRTSAAER